MFVAPGVTNWPEPPDTPDETVGAGSEKRLLFRMGEVSKTEDEGYCTRMDLLAGTVSDSPEVVARLPGPICEGFVWEIEG